MLPIALALASGLLPVLLFLAALRMLDGFKLVHRSTLVSSLVAGAVAALVVWAVNAALLGPAHVDPALLRLAIAPVVEEGAKAAFVAWLIRRERVGFLVDAAIAGFAVGAGFALVENLYYLGAAGSLSPPLWIVRGFGTAIMHGSATAVFAIASQALGERYAFRGPHLLLPGLAVAIAIHAAYNRFAGHPLLTTAALLVGMPIVLLAVFAQSERATRDWLGHGLDSDVEMLEQILDGEVHGTPIGHYLESLKAHFEPLVVADMLCLLRIHLELSLRAKGMLIARAAGVELRADEAVKANLIELRYLEKSIGPTGQLALLPLRRTSVRDLWQVMRLAQEAGEGRAR